MVRDIDDYFELSRSWVFDETFRSTITATGNRNLLRHARPVGDIGVQYVGGQEARPTMVGEVQFNFPEFDGPSRLPVVVTVYYVPDMRASIFSPNDLVSFGEIAMDSETGRPYLRPYPRTPGDTSPYYALTPWTIRDLVSGDNALIIPLEWFSNTSPVANNVLRRPTSFKADHELKFWHLALGHLVDTDIKPLLYSTGQTFRPEARTNCEVCEDGGTVSVPRLPYDWIDSHRLHTLFVDVVELTTASFVNHNLFLFIKDRSTGYLWYVPLNDKAELFEALIAKLNEIKVEFPNDRIGEVYARSEPFEGSNLGAWLEENGINCEFYSYWEEEVIEETSSIISSAHNMIQHAHIHPGFQSMAIRQAVHIFNLIPRQSEERRFRAPYYSLYSGKLDDGEITRNISLYLTNLRIFGESGDYQPEASTTRAIDVIYVGADSDPAYMEVFIPSQGLIKTIPTAHYQSNPEMFGLAYVHRRMLDSSALPDGPEKLLLTKDEWEAAYRESCEKAEEIDASNYLPLTHPGPVEPVNTWTIRSIVQEADRTMFEQANGDDSGDDAHYADVYNSDSEATLVSLSDDDYANHSETRVNEDEANDSFNDEREDAANHSVDDEDSHSNSSSDSDSNSRSSSPISEEGRFLVGPVPLEKPKSYKEAAQSRWATSWIAAADNEIQMMRDRKVWELVDRERNMKVMRSKWVFKQTAPTYGVPVNHKATLVACNRRRKRNVEREADIEDASIDIVLLTLAVAVHHMWNIRTFNITSDFLYAPLERPVFMAQPEGYGDGTSRVWRLNKSICGLKPSPREGYKALSQHLESLGFEKVDAVAGVFMSRAYGDKTIVVLYRDGVLAISSDREGASRVRSQIANRFQVNDSGKLGGLWFKKTWMHSTLLDCTRTEKALLKETKDLDTKEFKIIDPITRKDANLSARIEMKLEYGMDLGRDAPGAKKLSSALQARYKSVVSSLNYLATHGHPSIALAACHLSRHTEDPRAIHWKMMLRTLYYLRKEPGSCLAYWDREDPSLVGFASANGIGRSYDGITWTYGRCQFHWQSRRQDRSTSTSREANLRALVYSLAYGHYARKYLRSIGEYEPTKESICYTGSKVALKDFNAEIVPREVQMMNLRVDAWKDKSSRCKIVADKTESLHNMANIVAKPLSAEEISDLLFY